MTESHLKVEKLFELHFGVNCQTEKRPYVSIIKLIIDFCNGHSHLYAISQAD